MKEAASYAALSAWSARSVYKSRRAHFGQITENSADIFCDISTKIPVPHRTQITPVGKDLISAFRVDFEVDAMN